MVSLLRNILEFFSPFRGSPEIARFLTLNPALCGGSDFHFRPARSSRDLWHIFAVSGAPVSGGSPVDLLSRGDRAQ